MLVMTHSNKTPLQWFKLFITRNLNMTQKVKFHSDNISVKLRKSGLNPMTLFQSIQMYFTAWPPNNYW